jgi:predicted metal-dependent peptidase
MIKPARMNPRAVLASALRGASAAVRGSSSRTYAKPSRRREVLRMTMGDEAPILPGYRGDEPKAVVVLDTSGSMGRDRMGAALSELVGLARAAALPLWALAVDADVHAERQIKTQKDALDLAKGGGGTDMRAGIAAAQEPRRKANIIVVITDGETPWPTAHEMPKEQRLVLVIVNQSRRVMHHVPAYLQTHAFYLPVGEMAQ